MNQYTNFLYRILIFMACMACSETKASHRQPDAIALRLAAQKARISAHKEQERKMELERKLQLQTTALLKRVGREVSLTTHKEHSSSLAMILHHPALVKILAAYTHIEIASDACPLYNTNIHGILNSQDLCYIIAPAQLAWALQGSLYKRGRIPEYIGQGGSDVCTLLTTALKEHEKQEKISEASPTELLFPLRDWLQHHTPEIYPLEKGQPLKQNTRGLAHKVLELYLSHLNQQCEESELPKPCPTIKFLDGTSNYPHPIVEFMPIFIEQEDGEDAMSDCEEDIKKSIASLSPHYPMVVRMVPQKFIMATKITALPVTVKLQTPLGPVTYIMRGALLNDHVIISHSTALIRQDTQPNAWVICDDHTILPMNQEWTTLANQENTVLIDNTFPTDIIYERQ